MSDNPTYDIAPQNYVLKLKQTCSACPSQWEGETADRRPVYIRYRFGYLSVQIGDPGEALMTMLRRQMDEGSPYFFGDQLGGEYDGEISLRAVEDALGERLAFAPVARYS